MIAIGGGAIWTAISATDLLSSLVLESCRVALRDRATDLLATLVAKRPRFLGAS
jgi:hypothetical protein